MPKKSVMNPRENRRAFLEHAMLLPIGVAAVAGVATASEPMVCQRNPSRIKLSLNAWSFSEPLYAHLAGKNGGMSLFELLEYCAELEFDALDPTGYFFPGYPDRPDRKFINEFKRRAFQLGIEISGTGVRNDFATSDKAVREEGIQVVKQWTEVAAEMGAPVLRVFAGPQPKDYTWDEAASWLADSLAECVEYGEQNGVVIGLQNHGGMLTNAEQMLKILERVDSPWLGLIVDTGWFTGADPYGDIERTIPHAVNWQVKERLNGDQGAEADLPRIAKLILDSNYRGYVPIETLNTPGNHDSHLRVPAFVKQWRQAIAEVP